MVSLVTAGHLAGANPAEIRLQLVDIVICRQQKTSMSAVGAIVLYQ